MLKLDLNPAADRLREFGAFSLGGFALIGFLVLKLSGSIVAADICLAIGALLGLLAAFDLGLAIRPFYVALMCVGAVVGLVVSQVLLGVIYFGMFTPVALLFRLIGRDSLQRNLDKSAKSYWHVRPAPRTAASYLRLY